MKKQVNSFLSKIMIAFGVFFFVAIGAMAQSDKEEIDLFQAAFGMGKKDVVAGFLQLDSSSPFWNLYDQYETERKELGKKRITLLQNYADKYGDMSDADLEDVMKQTISLQKSTDKLIDTYYNKVKKASGAKTAAQFYQIETYILSVVRVTILESIPFIGELE